MHATALKKTNQNKNWLRPNQEEHCKNPNPILRREFFFWQGTRRSE